MTVLRIPIRSEKEPDRIFFIASNFKREKRVASPCRGSLFLPGEKLPPLRPHRGPAIRTVQRPEPQLPDTKTTRRIDNLTPRKPNNSAPRQPCVPTIQRAGTPTAPPGNSAPRQPCAPSARRPTRTDKADARFPPVSGRFRLTDRSRPAEGQRGYSSSSSP